LSAGAKNLKYAASIVPKKPFGHLASGRIPRTQYQHSLIHVLLGGVQGWHAMPANRIRTP
jgi:hypothetical protein